jgi:hypothetical protein
MMARGQGQEGKKMEGTEQMQIQMCQYADIELSAR